MAVSGISHVGLTVTDLDRSTAWYADVLGWTQRMRGRGDTSSFAHGALPNGLSLVLRVHDQAAEGPFNETRPGLDHLSFAVESMADLETLEKNLAQAGADFTPKRDLSYAWMLTFRDPDGIALEAMLGK
jgi:glyoxylase I family protein